MRCWLRAKRQLAPSDSLLSRLPGGWWRLPGWGPPRAAPGPWAPCLVLGLQGQILRCVGGLRGLDQGAGALETTAQVRLLRKASQVTQKAVKGLPSFSPPGPRSPDEVRDRSGGRVICQRWGQGGRKWGGHPFINSHWGGQPHPTGLSLPVGAYEQKGEMGGTPSHPPHPWTVSLEVRCTLSILAWGAAPGWGQRPRGFQEEGADHQAEIPEGPVLGVA